MKDFGDKLLTILRRNPIAYVLAHEAGVSLEDAYKIQEQYVGLWQRFIKIETKMKAQEQCQK